MASACSRTGPKDDDCTKVQTGGPDENLGFNEIVISKDETIGIVDGSGAICDPKGLNRDGITRLATTCVAVSNFNRSKLGADGFKVLINDLDVTFPDRNLLREEPETCPIKKCRQEASRHPEGTTADFLSTWATL